MRLPYKFPNIRQFSRLRLEVENRDGRMAIGVKRPLSVCRMRFDSLFGF